MRRGSGSAQTQDHPLKSILQAIAEQSRIVRLPLNQVGSLSRISKAFSKLEQEFEREPTHLEIAAITDIPIDKIADALRVSGRHVSMDAPFVQGEENTLLDVIEKTVYASGESDTRYTLNGLLFHIFPNGKLTVVGTDGHRLAYIFETVSGTIKEERKLIIPRKAAIELRKLLDRSDDQVSMTLCKNHVLFTLGDIQFLEILQKIPEENDVLFIVGGI